jgi:hypothetical protein
MEKENNTATPTVRDDYLQTLNPGQNQYHIRNLETNIYKLHANYKLLLKKHSSLCAEKSIGKQEDLQIETASRNIVSIFFCTYWATSLLIFLFFCFR